MNDLDRDPSSEPTYIGYVYLPNSRCRVRFVKAPVQPTPEQTLPVWAFLAATIAASVLIGACGVLLLIPYGALCR